jgi:4,5-DOPA dioxygenase extradiol
MANRMPAIFFGHGNPLNALSINAWTAGWTAIGRDIPRPRAVLCVSAHWYLPASLVTGSSAPRTIHDFGGFPRELYEVKYPAPGDPRLAQRVGELLGPVSVELDDRWGLDHGSWSVLCHLFPEAEVPVIQLSIDETQPSKFHYETAQRLRSLRDEGVLIVGSGNLVHNPMPGAGSRSSHSTGQYASRNERVSCCSPAIMSHSSTMRL